MEQLKKELQEKGYTFFRMQDYPQFSDEYIKYKKYICNSETNLLHHIDSVRVDGAYSKKYYKSITDERYHLDEQFDSFEEIDKKITTEYLQHADMEHISQYWYYGFPHDVVEDFYSLIDKIVENLYNIKPDSFQHLANLTYYKKDCFLREHRDGQTGTRICAVLVYLNDDDYKMEWGGNIIFEGIDTIPPIYGNVAVLDFKEGNCLHEVKKIVDGYGRYAILDFVSLGTPPERRKY